MDRERPAIRTVLLTGGVAAALWSLAVWATGGLHLQIFGVRVSSTDPFRPLIVAVAAFGLYGWRWPGRLLAQARAAATAPIEHARIAVGAMAAAVFAAAMLCGSTVATGADSYGYVSEAALWRHAQLIVPVDLIREVPWPHPQATFAPLGYRPSPTHPDAIVPTYAPGLPLLMALVQLVLGYGGAFLVVPVSAAAVVWFTFLLGRRIFGAPGLGVFSALLVAVSPTFLMQSMWPMSDVPAAAAWTAALALILSGWPLAAGLAASLTLAIRPNLVALPCALLVWSVACAVADARRRVGQGDRTRDSVGAWVGSFGPTLRLSLGMLPGVVLIAAVNHYLYGSPVTSGYGATGTLYSLARLPANLSAYGGWLVETETPAIAVAALFLLVPRWAEPARVAFPRLLLGGTVAATLVSYLFYLTFDAWWYLRFLLPMWPAMMLLLAASVDGVWRRWMPRLRPVALALCVGFFAWHGLSMAAARHLFEFGAGERHYVDVARFVDAHTEPGAVVLAMQHSGSLRLYAGRTTVRYDWLEEAWLDRAAAYFQSIGRHPYIVLESWEVDQFRRQFAGKNRLGRLDWLPIGVLRGWNDVALYDAVDTSSARAPVAIPAVSVKRATGWPVEPPHPMAAPFP